ncbi:PREDICTED: uncharacterized protein C17orf47 homolog [Dipodomys ordii]|uniref:Uncharacterized protein C17orf47 homolog n=1 Tax=Dipodomys ordii TaxID=10020 RepID=A0A1S3EYN0_DIPOR|nr:PREDICTED: uncharacterized protein C17orf47 homolog [Dipodomys ordii]
MASTQKGSVYQVAKSSRTGSKIAVPAHRGTETISATQRGHGYINSSSQQNAAVSLSPNPQRRSEAMYNTTAHSASDYLRSLSMQSGPPLYTAYQRGMETRQRTDAPRHSSPHRKMSAFPTMNAQRNVSPIREEAMRSVDSKPGRDIGHRISSPDAKSPRRLSFIDEKESLQLQNLEEEDPPSKVQNPQGVRVPRRISSHPKDEAVQTDPIRKISNINEVKSPRSVYTGGSRAPADHRAVLRRTTALEPEMGPTNPVLPEPKASIKNTKLAPTLKLSVLRDLPSGYRVPVRSEGEPLQKHYVCTEAKPPTKVIIPSEVEANEKSLKRDSEIGRRVTISPMEYSVQAAHRLSTRGGVSEAPHKSPIYPEPCSKPSIQAELELTPRPLPPRSLPRYGPDCSWWALLNRETEMPQSRPCTPDFEHKSPPPLDPIMSFYEMDSNLFCEDLMFQREKPFPHVLKHASKQLIQGFNAFFLDVSEEMQNRILWWLKGLCLSFLWVHCGGRVKR